MQIHLDKLKLSRVAYVGIGLLLYVASIYMVSWASVAVLTLLIVAYLRTLLKPGEVGRGGGGCWDVLLVVW